MHSTNYRSNRLKARVVAMNRCNEAVNELYLLLAAIFTPLAGQKVVKADGSLLAKYAAQVKPIMDKFNTTGPQLSVWHAAASSRYSLVWTVKVCESMPEDGTCVYEDASVYVGNMEGQIFKDIIPADVHRTDYAYDEIVQLRAEYEEKKKTADAARSALFPFGESDR